MAELMDKYKDAIKEKEDTEKAFEEIEETLELHCIKFDDLPELTANQLESIESILI